MSPIRTVVFAIKMSKLAVRLVRASVGIAAAGITLASLASVLGSLPLWLVVFIHEGGTVLVCCLSLLCALVN